MLSFVQSNLETQLLAVPLTTKTIHWNTGLRDHGRHWASGRFTDIAGLHARWRKLVPLGGSSSNRHRGFMADEGLTPAAHPQAKISGQVHSLVFQITRDAQAAEGALQVVFWQLQHQAPRVNDQPGSLRGWTCSIGRSHHRMPT